MTAWTGLTVAQLRAALSLLPDDGQIVLHGDDFTPESLEVEIDGGRYGWIVLHRDRTRENHPLWAAAERVAAARSALPTAPVEVCS